jgi:2-polyprenyl-3-methyl-5-hydroxy-6-metoxy-1,4-benzoquinol methylase
MARNPVAVEMRRQLHDHFDRVFRPGDRVLDLTAGTGADALYLAARGIAVTALDASPGMIAELTRHAAQRGLQVDARVLAAEDVRELDGRFDGAISTFGGLNTVEDLPRLAGDLAACVTPRGRVILHALNAFCLWQAAAQRLGRGGKRDGEMRVGKVCVQHKLYNPYVLWHEVFAPWFRLRKVYGLSVIAAPAVVTRWPRWAPLIWRLDHAVGQRLQAAGDFFVMDLERSDDRAQISR